MKLQLHRVVVDALVVVKSLTQITCRLENTFLMFGVHSFHSDGDGSFGAVKSSSQGWKSLVQS